MSIIQAELYDAFIEAGVSETKARAAATTVATIPANYPKPEELATKEYIEKRVAQLETRIAELEGRMDSKMAELRAEIAELRAEIAELKVAIAELKAHQSRNTMILAGIMIGTITIATTVIIAFIN